MKKDISLLPHKYRYGSLFAHSYGFATYIEVDVHNSNFHRGSRFFVLHWVTSSRNPFYGKVYFRFNGDTYYFDP